MIKTFNTLFVTMFGLGKIPKIPGTFGCVCKLGVFFIIKFGFIYLFNGYHIIFSHII